MYAKRDNKQVKIGDMKEIYPEHRWLKSVEGNQKTNSEQLGAILECVGCLENAGFSVPETTYREIVMQNKKERQIIAESDQWLDSYATDSELIAFGRSDGSWAHIYYNPDSLSVTTAIYGYVSFEEGINMLPSWVNGGK
jgi:hypothetical protein